MKHSKHNRLFYLINFITIHSEIVSGILVASLLVYVGLHNFQARENILAMI